MGQRLLEIQADLITSICMGLGPGAHQFEVTADALPVDARIVSICQSQYWSNTVEVLLSSASWSDEPPRTKIVPRFSTVRPTVKSCHCGGNKLSCGVCGGFVIECAVCNKVVQEG